MTTFHEEMLEHFKKNTPHQNSYLNDFISQLRSLVGEGKKAFSVGNVQIDTLFEHFKEWLPEKWEADEVRRLANAFCLAKMCSPYESAEDPLQKERKNERKSFEENPWWKYPGAYGRGKHEFLKFGGDIVGPGEKDIFFPGQNDS